MAAKRAIGIVRVSEVGGREGESFVSPSAQRERIVEACKRDGMTLVEVFDELDVSGGTPLERRDGLRAAVEAVEAGRVEVIVAAYFDRLVRSLSVQDELVSRVERAGGGVLALDVGAVSSGSAGQWLSATLLGAVHEYQRRSTAERVVEAQARAVARGVAPYPCAPPGYRRGDDGRLAIDEDAAEVVREVFAMRAGGASVSAARAHLREHGIARSTGAVYAMFSSRVYLGEVRFGELVNVDAHPALVDSALWRAASATRSPRGRHAKSERLLARLGVLRCGSCDSSMVATTTRSAGRHYHYYRCATTRDCEARATIGAVTVERIVVERLREVLAHSTGRASVRRNVQAAEVERDRAQEALDAAVRLIGDLELGDEAEARRRLAELRTARDGADERLQALRNADASALVINAASDWPALSLAARRALIRAVIDRVDVAPGRGDGRLTFNLRGE